MISKRSIFILLMAFVVAMQTHAQDKRPKFSPEKFKADMEQFIVKEACLTPEESAKFFPVYDGCAGGGVLSRLTRRDAERQ